LAARAARYGKAQDLQDLQDRQDLHIQIREYLENLDVLEKAGRPQVVGTVDFTPPWAYHGRMPGTVDMTKGAA